RLPVLTEGRWALHSRQNRHQQSNRSQRVVAVEDYLDSLEVEAEAQTAVVEVVDLMPLVTDWPLQRPCVSRGINSSSSSSELRLIHQRIPCTKRILATRPTVSSSPTIARVFS